jgi:hypothetical protein
VDVGEPRRQLGQGLAGLAAGDDVGADGVGQVLHAPNARGLLGSLLGGLLDDGCDGDLASSFLGGRAIRPTRQVQSNFVDRVNHRFRTPERTLGIEAVMWAGRPGRGSEDRGGVVSCHRATYDARVTDPRLNRPSPKMRAVHELDLRGLTPAEIGKRLLMSEFAVRTFLEVIEERLNPSPQTED